jgi:hypothetical protein
METYLIQLSIGEMRQYLDWVLSSACSSGNAASAQSSWWYWPQNHNICHIPNCEANKHLESAVIKIVHSHAGKYTN